MKIKTQKKLKKIGKISLVIILIYFLIGGIYYFTAFTPDEREQLDDELAFGKETVIYLWWNVMFSDYQNYLTEKNRYTMTPENCELVGGSLSNNDNYGPICLIADVTDKDECMSSGLFWVTNTIDSGYCYAGFDNEATYNHELIIN